MFCKSCGKQVADDAVICASCGAQVGGAMNTEAKSKIAAGLLGIFLGAFGVHRLYLGFNTIGIIQLVLGALGFVTCGITSAISGIWGLVEGILILVGQIPTDANGVPLRD